MTTASLKEPIDAGMKALGWDKGANAGSVKRDANGRVISQCGSAEYARDYDVARMKAERDWISPRPAGDLPPASSPDLTHGA